MRKYLWIAIIAIIGCTVYFIGCEPMPKMMEPILSDAEQVEPPVGSADVLIYIGSVFWITPENAAIDAETTRSLLQTAGIEAAVTGSEASVRDWMLQTTADGAVNVLILYGVIPNAIYAAGNTESDGSVAENWIETTDGDTILNHADYFGWSSTDSQDSINNSANQDGSLQNIMDIPNIRIPTDSEAYDKPMIVTADGMALTPSLFDFGSDRAFPLNQLQGDWFAEKVFASDTGDADATIADPVIVRDGELGRLAIVIQTEESQMVDPNKGKVAAEVIINYLLAVPLMPVTAEPPAEEAESTEDVL